MKVEILKAFVDGRDREAAGIVTINGTVFAFDLVTEDGMTSICIDDESLESTDELFAGVDGFALYEAILDATNEAGYELDDEY
jgi:hypothetical protein